MGQVDTQRLLYSYSFGGPTRPFRYSDVPNTYLKTITPRSFKKVLTTLDSSQKTVMFEGPKEETGK